MLVFRYLSIKIDLLLSCDNNFSFQGVGDAASVFRIHETLSHYVTLQHDMSNQFVGLDHQKNLVPANHVTNGSANSEFEVLLVVRMCFIFLCVSLFLCVFLCVVLCSCVLFCFSIILLCPGDGVFFGVFLCFCVILSNKAMTKLRP